jgi:hypothetical protein
MAKAAFDRMKSFHHQMVLNFKEEKNEMGHLELKLGRLGK